MAGAAVVARRLTRVRLLLAIALVPVAGVAADCVSLSADRYGLPVELVQAVLTVEGGQTGEVVSNANGTEDLGPMQINSVWLPRLKALGITREQLLRNRCINILVGSWILANQFKAARGMQGPLRRRLWWAVGAYHSQTPQRNVRYALKVWKVMRKETLSQSKTR